MKLGTYKNLNLGKSEPTKVTKEEVDSELTKLLQSKVSYNTKNGKSQIGDTVNIDYEGFSIGKGKLRDLILMVYHLKVENLSIMI